LGPKGGMKMNIIERIMVEPFERFYEKLLVFLPNLITSIILLVIGILLGIFVKWVFLRIFRAINIDGLSQKFGMSETLLRSGLGDPPSVIISRVLKWFTIITFIIVAMQNLSIPTVEHLIDRIFLYLPNILISGLILILGHIISNFLGRAALIASVNSGMASAGLVGKAVKFSVFILACTMALEQLGIGKDTIIIAFAIVFGGVVFAFSIAFGLGGRNIAGDYLRRRMMEPKNKDDEISHL
jgi:Mechanosensitive ion channel, conserved TM helix